MPAPLVSVARLNSLGVCGALLPFGLLPWTRSFAMKGIAAVVAHGVHLMLVAVATALAESVVQNLKFSGVPMLHETCARLHLSKRVHG